MKDKKNLDRILKINEKRFREVERRVADVIEAITNSGIKYDEGKEAVDVCQAIQEIRQEERHLGEQDGELKKAQEAARNLYNLGVEIEKNSSRSGICVGDSEGMDWNRIVINRDGFLPCSPVRDDIVARRQNFCYIDIGRSVTGKLAEGQERI